ncbi:hypothetical protein B0H11DRAFT_2402639 [Mycena galericulata]|nr:hypothetical protein B0H11DRAFT_2402639 [Mycena galericulata]
MLSGFKATTRGIANFWVTHVPQGKHPMTSTGAADPPPDEPISAAETLAHLQDDMETANLSQPVSERILDESIEDGGEADEGAALLDDEVDQGDEDDELHLDAEQQSAETTSKSVNAQWLETALETVKKQVSKHEQPQVYKDGQLWIYPKDPIFALRDAATTGVYSPDALYQLPIFLWLPDYLPGHPDRFNCECGEALNKHSYNTNPIARRVCTTSGSDYFLLTKRYYCPQREGNIRGCGRTYQGSDPWILSQLPRFVQDRFPVAISHRSALDISQMDTMKITFAGRFGADPFSKMVRELKYLRHSRLEAMYLHAALHYGLRGTERIPAFSAFKNPVGFAGYAPSTKYLKSMFTSWFASHRLYIDRIMSSLSGRVIKADHTFKTVDHQGRLPGGEAIHTALYDAVNDVEEVRFYGLTLTQGFAPLQGMYERLQVELARHGNPPTEAIYTDNPRLERNWHETVTPSLKRNVEHIVHNPFRELPEFKISGPSLFASSPDRIDTLCDEILQSLPADDSIYIALSLQLSGDNITAIQIRTESLILVFDVTVLTTHIPLALKSVLSNPRIIKFGHDINSTAKRLSSAWRFAIPTSSLVDLAKLAKLKGASADTNNSISTLCGAVLNFQFSKPDLSTPPPPVASQLADLAREVDCAWSIQVALMKLGSVGIPLQPSQMRAAQPVALVIGNKTQAWGELVEHNGSLIVPNTQGMILVSKAYSVIKLTKLFVPGFIVAKHGQTLEWLNVNGGHAVVQTRTLRSRAPEPPHPATGSVDDSDLGTPAPVTIPSITEQLLQEPHTHPEEVAAAISSQLDAGIASNSGNDDDTDLMDESPEPSSDDLERLLFESIQHAQNILHQPRTAETLASRVLDDAYHFMDRLLRLISKKHPAYKEFAHLFSETIFIRDGEDEANVREILKKKEIRWEYAIRAKKGAINRRVRRYIPSPEKLTFGIIPITPALATAHEITILPLANILLAPHHNDNHQFTLTQFSTKPVNLYRYLQLRQRTTAAVVPVHTRREFELFQENIGSFIPSSTNSAPEKVYKVTKYNEFACFWNRRVATQSPTELDSSKRIYFKLPEQLERHHKKSIQWKTARATLNIGENVAALEAIHELLRDPSRKAVIIGAYQPERVVTHFLAAFVGVDMSSFNPMAMRQQLSTERTIQAAIAAVPNLEPPPVQLEEQPLPQPELQQTILAFTPTRHDGDYELAEMARPAKKARLDGCPKPKRAARCCALCAHANCGLEETCKGRGGREKCEHKNQPSHRELGFEQATRKRHRKRG